jgi:serine/threonine protein kinase
MACEAERRVMVAGKYQLLKKIGAGSFGKIFSAKDTSIAKDTAIEEKQYAIKILALEHTSLLQNEVAIYETIKGVKNIPSLYASGTEGKFHYLVMDLLEQSLEQVHGNCGGQMALPVVLHLAREMLSIVEEIHARGILHRDLKPANFLLRTNAQQISELYLIDFGLAKCFLDEKLRHGELKTNESLVGTTRYMSVNVHHGLTASRRDDLESLGYLLLFLQQGKLLWQNQNSVADVAEIKQKFGWTAVAVGEFVLFILYCRNLGFADKPNYDYLRGLLSNLNKIV